MDMPHRYILYKKKGAPVSMGPLSPVYNIVRLRFADGKERAKINHSRFLHVYSTRSSERFTKKCNISKTAGIFDYDILT